MVRVRSPILEALISALLFGAATPASKVLLREIPPYQLAGLLYLGAALGVLPAAVRFSRADTALQAHRRSALRLMGVVVFGGVLAPGFLLLGLRAASAASVSLWLNLELVATAVLGTLMFRDALGRQGWLGVLAAMFAGMILALAEGPTAVRAGSLVAVACLCWGLDNQLTAVIDGFSPAQITFWKGLVAGAINLLVGVMVQPFHASLLTTASAMVVGAVCYGASIALYIDAAQRLGAIRGQMIFASAPFVGLALSAGVLGEATSAMQFVAAPILAVSVAAVLLDRHGHDHTHEAVSHAHFHHHDDDHHRHIHAGEVVIAGHSHWHTHEAETHSHPHWPDLHHRHPHLSTSTSQPS